MAKKKPKKPKGINKFVSIRGSTITLSHDEGIPSTDHTVAPGAAVTLNGKVCKMSDLEEGDTVILVGNPATTVAAIR